MRGNDLGWRQVAGGARQRWVAPEIGGQQPLGAGWSVAAMVAGEREREQWILAF